MYIPKEITIDFLKDKEDQDVEPLHIASFDYYTGILYAKDNNLEQTTEFNDVFNGTHFIVCCGDVMVKVKPTDYIDIIRRTL